MIASINPATGEIVATFDSLTESQLDEKLARAAEAFRTYRHTRLTQREVWMRRVAEILETEHEVPSTVTEQVMRWFGSVSEGRWDMDEAQSVRQVGLGLLRPYLVSIDFVTTEISLTY